MKYLLLFLVSFSLFAQEFKTELSEVDKQTYSIERLKSLNQMYTQAGAFCAAQSFHVDLVAECTAQAKVKAKDEFGQTINFLISKRIEDSIKKVTDDASELKCVSFYRQSLETLNISYHVGDNCAALKLLVPVK